MAALWRAMRSVSSGTCVGAVTRRAASCRKTQFSTDSRGESGGDPEADVSSSAAEKPRAALPPHSSFTQTCSRSRSERAGTSASPLRGEDLCLHAATLSSGTDGSNQGQNRRG
uniref:Uncharacterized protein n=1 Tax=Anguilla anguilla TaxID=7936 RepID=A0A0E9WPF7_ANGAN